MKRIKIFKAYFVLWLFVYFIVVSNVETFIEYFNSAVEFNVIILTILGIGTLLLLKGAKDLTMIAGTFGVLMYKKKGVTRYLEGIEKHFPSNIANKIISRAKQNMLYFTAQDKDEILTWIDEKFAGQNKYNGFFIATVLMIGLLGTFMGLLGAIGSMADIVKSLASSSVDVGAIMASFSGPLASMAVGFGSSLFGVIGAILLGFEGYLINRAQATLLEGVENWLNERLIDTEGEAVETQAVSTELGGRQKSFMDLFIEQVGSLKHEVEAITTSNTEFRSAFLLIAQEIEKSRHEQTTLFHSMKNAVDHMSQNTAYANEMQLQFFQKMHQTFEHSHRRLDHLMQTSYEATLTNKQLTESIGKLSAVTQETSMQLSKKDKLLLDTVLKHDERDKARKIEFFQLIESMQTIDAKIQKSLAKLHQNSAHEAVEKPQEQKGFKQFLQSRFHSRQNEEERL